MVVIKQILNLILLGLINRLASATGVDAMARSFRVTSHLSAMLGHLQHASPGFASWRKGKGLLRRFKVRIHAVDWTVIQLVANSGVPIHQARPEGVSLSARVFPVISRMPRFFKDLDAAGIPLVDGRGFIPSVSPSRPGFTTPGRIPGLFRN